MLIPIYVLFLHWIGDFVCQNRYMADNKSREYLPLMVHGLVYTLVLSLGLGWLVPFPALVPFLALNFGLHIAIDSVTSRLTKYFSDVGWIYPFFTMIGFDQFLHACCLLSTTQWFVIGIHHHL